MITKVRAPAGFKFKVTAKPYQTVIELFDNNKKVIGPKGKMIPYQYAIGRVSLVQDTYSKGFWRTHSSLNPEYHNKGLGVLLYARGIQWVLEHKHRVSSSGSSSEMARRLWKSKSIRKYFHIKQKKSKYYRADPAVGDRYDRWYAYEKK